MIRLHYDMIFIYTCYLIYALFHWVKGRGLDRYKDSFNYWLSHSRQAVERAFGMLTQRWGIFWRPFLDNYSISNYILLHLVIQCCCRVAIVAVSFIFFIPFTFLLCSHVIGFFLTISKSHRLNFLHCLCFLCSCSKFKN